MKFVIALILTGFGFSSISEAGCDHITAPRAASGKTYSARNHPVHPLKLTFHKDFTANFGSTLDAPSDKVFYYQGACMDRILVSYKYTKGRWTGLTGEEFLLYSQGSFDVFADPDSGLTFYRE